MGREARVIAEIGEWLGEGKLLLETDELIFRGAQRHAVQLKDITALEENNGWLTVVANGVEARFDLGDYAAKWLHAIRNPRTRIDKFDVKAASCVALIDVPDQDFVDEVAARVAGVTRGSVNDITGADSGAESGAESRDMAKYDLVLLGVAEPDALHRISQIRPLMKSNGAIWVIHPKGRADLSHEAVMAVARPLGLIDVKSARFDAVHAALKLMLPRNLR